MSTRKVEAPALPDPSDLASRLPDIRLFGAVDDEMLRNFLTQLSSSMGKPGPVVLELTTSGGNADTARRIALEVRLAQQQADKALYFFGKTMVYSAGVTVMSAFPPERRWLSGGSMLLIHERHMDKEFHFKGALRANLALVRDLAAEIESGQLLERQGFEDLVRGTRLSLDELMSHVMAKDWYISAAEALRLGLVSRLV